MSLMSSAVHISGANAETVGMSPVTLRLLADSDATDGALSTHRVVLGEGADGAVPHRHSRSTELFFVLHGTVEILCGQRMTTARKDDVVIVPPTLPHAFGAAAGSSADLLVVVAPGVQRFDFFRQLAGLATGTTSLRQLLDSQDRFDTFFLDSSAWNDARRTAQAGPTT